jgi:hypothetical protein
VHEASGAVSPAQSLAAGGAGPLEPVLGRPVVVARGVEVHGRDHPHDSPDPLDPQDLEHVLRIEVEARFSLKGLIRGRQRPSGDEGAHQDFPLQTAVYQGHGRRRGGVVFPDPTVQGPLGPRRVVDPRAGVSSAIPLILRKQQALNSMRT